MTQINGDEIELLAPIRLKFKDKKLLRRRARHLWKEALRHRPRHRVKSLKLDNEEEDNA